MSSYGIWNRNRCGPHVGALLQRVVSMGCHVSFTLIFSLACVVDCFHYEFIYFFTINKIMCYIVIIYDIIYLCLILKSLKKREKTLWPI